MALGHLGKLVLVAFSGGKDSVATAILAVRKHGKEKVRLVFCDTGNEHELTLEYIPYVAEALGVQLVTLRADLSGEVERKKEIIQTKWRADGIPEERIQHVLQHLVPTGNPFLDLCLAKGQFPTTMVRFCTDWLKKFPSINYQMEMMAQGYDVESWQGVRADESPNRANLAPEEMTPEGILIVRPVHKYTARDVFELAKAEGIRPNPLYLKGMSRVGCMPCINCRKEELKAISKIAGQHVDRIERWEQIVSEVTKWGTVATFFHTSKGDSDGINAHEVRHEKHGIRALVEWSHTTKGSKKQFGFDFEPVLEEGDGPLCTSVYGLCE